LVKILLCAAPTEYNFGIPSLLHGAEEIIKELHDECKIIFYQTTKPLNSSVNDIEARVFQIPYHNNVRMLVDSILFIFGIKPKSQEKRMFHNHIKSSDIVVNIYGICFCSDLVGRNLKLLRAFNTSFNLFTISIISKLYKIKTVKGPASYGPMKSVVEIIPAKFFANYIFDVVYAREEESMRQMKEVAGIKSNIRVSPDLANFMQYDSKKGKGKNIIGISISHQILRQWNSTEPYFDCIVNFIRHISKVLNYKVILIPNEVMPWRKYNDYHVALDVLALLNNKENFELLDVTNLNSTQIKNCIAECELLVSSRYHSCVAGLSAGVPTLVIGWHHKYTELLHLYNQDRWILSNDLCTSERLINMFDSLWERREEERSIIEAKHVDVRNKLIEAGKILFSCKY
jgi:polysaccharide pyruvyl transferase WcaK-like protein